MDRMVRSQQMSHSLGLSILLGLSVMQSSLAAPHFSSQDVCQQEFEPFVSKMLAEIPAYVNRVNTRANNPHSSVILAGSANFEDLPLLQASFPQTSPRSSDVQQVFFSTLLRRFSQQQIVHQQEHHWLFMAPSDRGWEFVQMYSILDSYPSQTLATPPRDSSNGAMATAIKDWLKVCRTAD